ncbi:hypothetical protein P872_20835 [Rhodonellum psychrophilum GCM71 = DSM 17998]|uniref:Uncharacterized protein n=1 Tax=Rhodonellum psychrophilum GCM71 = DSM 17998 TaxID=1123057 RepID=U5BYX1_9BACT|nr:hypothetical protein P872_20835 [Rhodonellum psychrophilum GCM71 = DSM 17998]
MLHLRIHWIVFVDGFDKKSWKGTKYKTNRFLFPQKSLSSISKAMFMKGLENDNSSPFMHNKFYSGMILLDNQSVVYSF